MRKGNTLVVWKLDRLDRSVKGLVNLVAELDQKEVQFKRLTNDNDTNTTAGRFFFQVMIEPSALFPSIGYDTCDTPEYLERQPIDVL